MEISKTNLYILWTLKSKTIILICVHTKTSKFDKPSVGQGLKIFILVWNTEFLKKHLQRWIFDPRNIWDAAPSDTSKTAGNH